jgi:DNA segregation ATPase FtsK/SpoIIIE, S-DNA-T family
MPTESDFAVISTITLKLAQMGLEVSFVEPITTGPIITTYRFVPKQATKVNQISNCAEDLALALHVEDVLVQRLPGEGVIGVSVPKKDRTMVLWRDTLAQPPVTNLLPLNFGVDSQGRLFRDDLTKCPHLLIAGSTGGGKSVLMHSLIASLMYWRSPDEVLFILSDTKQVEFGHFKGSPHLICDPVTTMFATWDKMDWLITKVEDRLTSLAKARVHNIQEYNVAGGGMPYIILVIDELSHILGGGERGQKRIANDKLQRIISQSRAAGVHVLAATQRPTVDIVNGSIKTNFPARLTFRLSSEADSRTVLDRGGAEHLLTQGDMLYTGPACPALTRLHSAYTSVADIEQCVAVAKMKSTMCTK